MKTYSLREHFIEIKRRFLVVFTFFLISFVICFVFKEQIFKLFLSPLVEVSSSSVSRKIIYTGLAEAFFSYVKLSFFSSFYIIVPVICYQLYGFLKPALFSDEKKLVVYILFFLPVLFYLGSFFVFYFVMPRAWLFFLNYENKFNNYHLVLEPRISEYLDSVIQFTLAFGLAFQLPIILVLLNILGMISSGALKRKRRLSIVIIFIVAAIFTPPDVFSQIALAIPLFLLYEVSIVLCKISEKRGS